MSFVLKTIEVEHPDIPGEKMIINESDFNPALHAVFSVESIDAQLEQVNDGAIEAKQRRKGAKITNAS